MRHPVKWTIKCRTSSKSLDGAREWVTWYRGRPVLFDSRKRAQGWIDEHYGYQRRRPDLKAHPHGCLMPIPVRVEVILRPLEDKP